MDITAGDNVTAEGLPLAQVKQVLSLSDIDSRYPDVKTLVLHYEEDGTLKEARRMPTEVEKPPHRQDENPLGGLE
ncbi:hypothetical protein GGQ03_003070 [Salinibacter ruber]|jgi:hypothetical protein|uniref:hypothetical protein n=1 Tax=Salinibacter ruber TaxID=146919 RepID=UPI002169D687|nr:hypothetical protein [Salinibacter ruber]MCS4155765.1 hypothetical protein [Salinibacter ruber]